MVRRQEVFGACRGIQDDYNRIQTPLRASSGTETHCRRVLLRNALNYHLTLTMYKHELENLIQFDIW
jgi:hypothetical protein